MAEYSAPRRVNLGIRQDYFSKPTTKFLEWLETNLSSLRELSEDQIILRARTTLGPEISVLNRGDLSSHIRAWARAHDFALAGDPGGPVRAGDPAIVERLKDLFGSIPTEAKWVGNQGSAAMDVSGLTATLDAGKIKYALQQGWDGALEFKTQASGMEFDASIGPKNWSLTFTIGRKAPSIPDF